MEVVMKKLLILAVFLPLIAFSGTPTIDGVFDGTSVWGMPVATADGIAGWSGNNVKELYVTYDANYAYFAASFHTGGAPGSWQYVAFAINTKNGGGSNDPWAVAITYGYTNKPDFVLIGRLQDSYAELRVWNGSDWTGANINVYPNDIKWSNDYLYVEGRILQSTLGYPTICDVQFYSGGNNFYEHGVFDACPDDEVMQSWNDPTTLHNYSSNVSLPVQLSSFIGYFVTNNSVKLEWETISEKNNFGFYVEKFNSSLNSFVTVSDLIPGVGHSLQPQRYTWTDENAIEQNLQYRLMQVDNDGLVSYFGPIMLNPTSVKDNEIIPAVFKLYPNYPNPFNPKTLIKFSVAKSGFTTLKVYNILGNEVATLYSGNAEAGKIYQIEFDASQHTSGIYFSKLTNSSDVQLVKMVLTK